MENNQTETVRIEGVTRRNRTTYKKRIECLMAWREQQKIVCKEPIENKERKEAIKYELNVLTKRQGKTWHKQPQ